MWGANMKDKSIDSIHTQIREILLNPKPTPNSWGYEIEVSSLTDDSVKNKIEGLIQDARNSLPKTTYFEIYGVLPMQGRDKKLLGWYTYPNIKKEEIKYNPVVFRFLEGKYIFQRVKA